MSVRHLYAGMVPPPGLRATHSALFSLILVLGTSSYAQVAAPTLLLGEHHIATSLPVRPTQPDAPALRPSAILALQRLPAETDFAGNLSRVRSAEPLVNPLQRSFPNNPAPPAAPRFLLRPNSVARGILAAATGATSPRRPLPPPPHHLALASTR